MITTSTANSNDIINILQSSKNIFEDVKHNLDDCILFSNNTSQICQPVCICDMACNHHLTNDSSILLGQEEEDLEDLHPLQP